MVLCSVSRFDFSGLMWDCGSARALWVMLSTLAAGRFSDGAFLLRAGEKLKVHVHSRLLFLLPFTLDLCTTPRDDSLDALPHPLYRIMLGEHWSSRLLLGCHQVDFFPWGELDLALLQKSLRVESLSDYLGAA